MKLTKNQKLLILYILYPIAFWLLISVSWKLAIGVWLFTSANNLERKLNED